MQQRFGIGRFWLSCPKAHGGTYFATWKGDQGTRRKSLRTRDLETAKIELARFVVEHGDSVDIQYFNPTLSLAFQRYWNGHAISTASAEATWHGLKRWNKHFGKEFLVPDLKNESVAEFVATLRSEGLSDAYIRRIVMMGRTALNWCHRAGELATVPAFDLPPRGQPREIFLTPNECAALLGATDEQHLFRYTMLGLLTAGRPSAILELQWEQIDFDAGLIRQNPKGRRQTAKHRPTVPLCDTLRAWLLIWQEDTGPVITYRGRQLKSIKKGFRRLRDRARLGKHVTAYALRHTAATVMRSAGVPQWEVSGWLGHSSGSTTDIYAHFDPDYLQKGRAALDRLFASPALLPFGAPPGISVLRAKK